ncbi:DUF5335 family protein [Longimicrobium sp.]|uniref:DUF5335 family protein n=1 Tax=Longimicrobium sp. TaxID=2029185 RepID=UPI002E2F2953|nr:DUF5335 family protein [Longimicrobium sp.]HEX6042578.1 DUF5335 family protein [Longimicrobium sp.]
MQTLETIGWARVLNDFTQRNGGRPTRMEVDDPRIGAQVQQTDYRLFGVAYDPRDGSVEVMTGDYGTTDGHMTHTIRHVTDVWVLTDNGGRDEALCIAHDHGHGQTLLHLLWS